MVYLYTGVYYGLFPMTSRPKVLAWFPDNTSQYAEYATKFGTNTTHYARKFAITSEFVSP